MAQTVYANFPNATQCEQAAGALLDFGVRKEDIALVARETNRQATVTATPEATHRRDIAEMGYRGGEANSAVVADKPLTEYDLGASESIQEGRIRYVDPIGAESDANTSKGYIITDARTVEVIEEGAGIDENAKEGISVTTPADAASGAVEGAGWGLGLGILAGLACLSIPGVGLVLGGGALATAIAGAVGATVAGAAAGGVVGYLKDQGMPEHIATDYDASLREGGAMLAVMTPSNHIDSMQAQSILQKYGATRVDVYNR
jgi:hypothetical protein